MSILDTARRLNVYMDWATLRLAWEWPSESRLVSRDEVIRVAEERLEDCCSRDLPWVAELATARDDRTVAEALVGLAPQDSRSSFWKLVCVLLEERLSTLPQDPINGPAELSEFWSDLGPPPGHPHVFQGVGNRLAPTEYYTLSNLENLLSEQRRWLDEKLDEVRREKDS